MKDFALDLNGCSKEDRKRVEEILSSIGLVLDSELPFKGERSKCLSFDEATYYYLSNSSFVDDNKPIYQMPRDWSKIQESLGVSVEPSYGSIYKLTHPTLGTECLCRVNNSTDDMLGSTCFVSVSHIDYVGVFCTGFKVGFIKFVKATPEEEKQLIEAEHKNGYHWDGKELVKIPEYVKLVVSVDCASTGEVYKVERMHNFQDGVWLNKGIEKGRFWLKFDKFKPSTLEAYEAQEAEKKECASVATSIINSAINSIKLWSDFEKQIKAVKSISDNAYYIGVDLASKEPDETVINIIKTDPIGLHAENEGLYVKIKDLEISNNELNVEIETKDKRISELEGNLLIMCELGNKVLS